MKIHFETEQYVVVEKPAGWHVHPPESAEFMPPKEKILLYMLRNKLRQRVYPVHRLDAGTKGLLVFGKSSEAAGTLHRTLQDEHTEKRYLAVVRGWTDTSFKVDLDLELDSTHEKVFALTQFERLQTIELPYAVGKRFPTTRYSLIHAWPRTGRFHQIRRHLNRISYTIIGDAQHGDSHHNRFFREQLQIEGLCLMAENLRFKDPWTGQIKSFDCDVDEKWQKIRQLFTQGQI